MLSPQRVDAARIDVAAMRGLERAQQCRQRSSGGLRVEAVYECPRPERAELVYGRTSFHRGRALENGAGPKAAFLPRARASSIVYLALRRTGAS